MKNIKVIHSSKCHSLKEYYDTHPYKWNIVMPGCSCIMNVHRINPMVQQSIKKLIDEACKQSSIKRIWLFGSSVSRSCTHSSDIDTEMKFIGEDLEVNANE